MRTEAPTSDAKTTRRAYARRAVVLAALACGTIAAAQWYNVGGTISDGALSVTDAHTAAADGRITLIDIRRPDEWARTGIGAGAIPIDMRDSDFVDQLLGLVADENAPIALICARGVRSRGLSKRLIGAGFTNIMDVPEGMLGSGAGAGWLKTGLPVTHL